MKHLSAIFIVGFLLMAQVIHLVSGATRGASGMPAQCCLVRQTFQSIVHAPPQVGTTSNESACTSVSVGRVPPNTDTAPILTRDCCHRSCCAQAPAPLAQTVPMAPVSPDVPRVLPNVLVMTFLWALPPAPAGPSASTLAFADASQAPAVPLITRHCALLI